MKNNSSVSHFIPSLVGVKNFVLPNYQRAPFDIINKTRIYFCNGVLSKQDEDNSILPIIKVPGFSNKLTSVFLGFWACLSAIPFNQSVVVAHFTNGATIPLIAAYVKRVEKRIYFNHGIPYVGYFGWRRVLLKLVEMINVTLSTEVITVSPAMRDIYLKCFKLDPSMVTVIGPGSSAGILHCYEDYEELQLTRNQIICEDNAGDDSNEVLRFLYVGRPVRRKGWPNVIHILDGVSAQMGVKIRLDVVGFKEDESCITKTLKSDLIEVQFHGFIDNVIPFYLKNHFVILPTLHEGFGYCLLEGASLGCIPIVSDVPGPDAIVRDDKTGFVMPRESSLAAIRLVKALKYEEVVEKIRERAFYDSFHFSRTNFSQLFLDKIHQ